MIRPIHCFIFIVSFLQTAVALGQYTVRDPNAIRLYSQDGSPDWRFALDPAGVGDTQQWYGSHVSPNRWDKVSVPHCFSVDPRYQFYTGTVWYRRSFPWQPAPDQRVSLHFDGAYYATTVWLNGRKVGSHEGGYTPFQFDITEYLNKAESDTTNNLAISVNNNTWLPGTIPGAKDNGQPNDSFTGWMNYGGLTRPVYLTVEPTVYIDNVKVEAEPDLARKTARLTIKTRVRNASGQTVTPSGQYQVRLKRSAGADKPLALTWKTTNKAIGPNQPGMLTAEAEVKTADLSLWSPDQPTLYDLTVGVGADTVETHFGIRKVEVKNAQLLLNGQSVRAAGGNRVVDYPGLGSMEPDWLVENDLRLMKEAGMELQRLTHYTPAETVYDWADKNGMLIIAEAGNWQLTPRQMGNDSIRASFRQQFRDMAERDWNHPSLIAYSVGNEYQSQTPEGQNWTKDMIAFARQLDPTRLCTFATLRLNALPEKPTDEASQYVDFVSTNTYGNHARVLDHIHQLYPDKPVFISEWGRRADTETGEAGQVTHLEQVMADIRKRPYVIGASWWSFNDYQSRYQGTNANGYRPWGLVDPDRNKRPLYAAHQREMAPLTVAKIGIVRGAGGVQQLKLRVTARPDFPAYALRAYRLKTIDTEVTIPDLRPGQSTDLLIPVRGFDQTLSVTVLKPTGFLILTQLIDLTK